VNTCAKDAVFASEGFKAYSRSAQSTLAMVPLLVVSLHLKEATTSSNAY
jgi:hypothetical protein